MSKPLSSLAIAVLLIYSNGTPALADDWTRFRGVNGTGVSDSTTLPTTWSDTENIAWKVRLPGAGSSSPIVTGDHIFVTCYSGYGIDRTGSADQLVRHLICVDGKAGKILWDKTVATGDREDPYQGYISEHGYASNSATTDGTHVFVFHGKSGVFAYDMEGRVLWNHSVGEESSNRQWGSASSLTLLGNKLIVNASEEGRAVIALDKETGKEFWKAEASALELSYGTPALVESDHGKTELVLAVPGEVWGLNSETGKLSWFVETQLTGNISPSPLVVNQSIYVFGGYRSAGSYRIRSGGKGDVTKSHIDWYSRNSSYVATPVHYDGRLYWIDDQGIAWCQEASSGKQVYRERVQQLRSGGRPVYASPIVADGKLYVVTRFDGTLIIPATSEFTVESQNVLATDESAFNATPAIYNNQLLLRSNQFLYCMRNDIRN